MHKLVKKTLQLPSELKKKVQSAYVDLGHKLVVSLLSLINRFARHLIVLQGKDPDYVPPPPPPPPTVKDAVNTTRPSFKFVNPQPSWLKESFKDPSQHIIHKSRAALAAKAAQVEEEPLQVVDPGFDVMTEVGGDAIDSLRKAMSDLEFDFALSHPVEVDPTTPGEVEITSGSRAVPAKKKVKAKKIAKSKEPKKAVRVKKVKKGVFSRVED